MRKGESHRPSDESTGRRVTGRFMGLIDKAAEGTLEEGVEGFLVTSSHAEVSRRNPSESYAMFEVSNSSSSCLTIFASVYQTLGY